MSFISCEVAVAVGIEIIYDFKLLLRHNIYNPQLQSSNNVNELFFFCFAYFIAHVARISQANSEAINAMPIAVEAPNHWNRIEKFFILMVGA